MGANQLDVDLSPNTRMKSTTDDVARVCRWAGDLGRNTALGLLKPQNQPLAEERGPVATNLELTSVNF